MAMTIKTVSLDSLKSSPYNPPTRMNGVRHLAASINEIGLQMPLLVSREGNVIVDGHRRMAALKALGVVEAPVIYVTGDAASTFAHVNTQARKLSGNETLCVYLKQPMAVGTHARAWLDEAETALGRGILERMASEGCSISTYRLAKQVARGADKENPAVLRTLVKWMLHFGNTGIVARAMAAGTSPGMLIVAAQKGKAIKPKFSSN